jgi:hypothetical protein
MNWGEILDLFLRVCENTPDAQTEQWQHLNWAHEHVCGIIDPPELHVPNGRLTAAYDAGPPPVYQDWLATPSFVYHVDWIANKDDGRKLDPEPDGFRGRARYFEDGENRPPTGTPQFWVRRGNRIWFRDTPNSELEFIYSYRRHPPKASNDSLETSPLAPPQYHMALVKFAGGNFFDLHPPMLPNGALDYQRAQGLLDGARVDMGEKDDPKAEENMDRRQYVKQMGYEFSIAGR